MNSFSISEALRFGWTEFKKYPWIYIGIGVLVGVVSMLGHVRYLGILISIMSIEVTLGFMKVCLNAYSGLKPEMNTVFSQWHKFFRALGVILIILGMILIPLLILGAVLILWGMTDIAHLPMWARVTGIILAVVAIYAIIIRYIFALYLIVDEEIAIKQSLKKSALMTKGIRGKLVWFFIVRSLITALGLLALGFGILITYPIAQLATAFVYKKVSGRTLMTTVVESTPTEPLPTVQV